MLVVDDHPLMISGLRAVAQEFPDCEIVGDAQDAASAVEAVETLQPDIVILEIRLGKSNGGIDVARQIKKQFTHVKILVLSAYDMHIYVRDLYRIGVDGYLLKTEPPGAVFEAIRSLAHDGVVFSREIMTRLAMPMGGEQAGSASHGAEFTDSELDLLQLLAGGLTNNEIAQRLTISRSGVDGHLKNVFGKLGARNRTEAVVRAAQLGFIVTDDLPRVVDADDDISQ